MVDALIVSHWIDTNGQNARFARAAERWGADPDVINALAIGDYDPANVANRFVIAAEKIGGLTIRAAHKSVAYFEFPEDLRWTASNNTMIRRLAKEADVIHLNNSHKAFMRLGLRHTRKPALLHHHGTLFRNNPDPLLYAAHHFRMVQAVSTIDLMKVAPDELTWLPTAYDLDELAVIGAKHRREPDGRIRVVSAPTNRAWKSTEELEAAIKQLQGEGLPVDLVLVEGKRWAECMAIKATADIYFDQVILGYGCNAIEAWGMGIPVIAGADGWTLDRMAKEYDGRLPFYAATVETIADKIRDMVQSKDLRDEWSGIGLSHAQKFHAEKPALAKLAELYARAIKAQA